MANQSDDQLKVKSYIVNSIANSLFFVIDPFINDMPVVTIADCKVPTNWNTIINKYGFCDEARSTIKAIQESKQFNDSDPGVKEIYNAYECENCLPCCDGASQISIADNASINAGAYTVFIQNVRYTLNAINQLQNGVSNPAAANQVISIVSALSVTTINTTLNSLKQLQRDLGVGSIGEIIFIGILVDEVINSAVLVAIDNYIAALSRSTVAAAVRNKDTILPPTVADADSKLKSVNSGQLARALENKAGAENKSKGDLEGKKRPGPKKLSIWWILFITFVCLAVAAAIGGSIAWYRGRAGMRASVY